MRTMPARASKEAEEYKARMRELSRSREFRAQFCDLLWQPTEVTEQRLAELGLNTRGSNRAKAERLFRAVIRTVGAAEVPWVPETDEAERVVVPEEEELRMEKSDHEPAYETDTESTGRNGQVTWPSDRGLPTTSKLPTGTTVLPSNPPPLFTMASSRQGAGHTSQASSLYTEAVRVLRITVREDRNHGAGQYLQLPPIEMRGTAAAVGLRHDLSGAYRTPMNSASTRERERNLQTFREARPKETWHRSRLSMSTGDFEDHYDERTELDDENIPRRGEFVRVSHLPKPQGTPRRQRKVVTPRDSTS